MSAGMTEILLPIVTDFSTSGRDSLSHLGDALRASRFAEARDILHQLKGASGTMGLVQFQELCAECEAQVSAEAIPTRLRELVPLLENSVAAATRYLSSP
jgi:HPt (histidine-containing phosphotransfer) domain-containing protein